ncbi:uncharacterized protein KGF55_002442 [Candida pseudojiufengensis]|uniref:uncharacterized protein n=1 Tax=Candida pseudojiufengensis TaxID=497109 RepID=UPI0022256D93|nr:uncharacterized protein KGF55_002442 [Candida pseudojiufengensis]KAI5963562.1 hypothetical protein KGF55_002442 [Candida pseudojiufengensis]
MTIQELHDEISAINSIYPDSVTADLSQIYSFKIPDHDSVSFQLNFPESYPDDSPEFLKVVSLDESKFTDVSYVEKMISSCLMDTFDQGQVVMFELLENLKKLFDQYDEEHATLEKPKDAKNPDESHEGDFKKAILFKKEEIDYTAGWSQSHPIIDRQSTFIAFARTVNTLEEALSNLEYLLMDKKLSKATHNISSWRIKTEQGNVYQDYDDDGETAAGSRLLHLLQMVDVWNVVVVVSRWFGGVKLGSDRFKHINAAARDALIQGEFMKDMKSEKAGRKKGV